MTNRYPAVPRLFAQGISECSKPDLVEIIWVLMQQSPWFDEMTANDNPQAVGEQVMLIRKANRETHF